jgi:YrbI family 3-deoxy-D-manno-octulosonate 8-phosphate phosphatase
MKNSEILCVIPARGGSKGIPYKNLEAVGARPLVAHAVEQARRSTLVSRVVVSTDDAVIANVARAFGAEVVDRPAELAGDTATSESALLHALETLAATEYRPELLVFLQCTAPLTTAEDIDGTIRALIDRGADSAFAAAPSHSFLWRRGPDGEAIAVNHDPRGRQRRQDREPELVEAGSVYVMRVEGFTRARHRFFGRTVLHEVSRTHLLEVDEPIDLEHAQVALMNRYAGMRLALLPARPAALVLDFDGVLTDNMVTTDQDGRESVRCSRGDGMGIERLRNAGVPVVVLSKEKNPVVSARCAKLGVPCVQGLEDKAAALASWLDEKGIDPADAVFLGNDVNDEACLAAVGCGVVVADAHPAVMRAARFVLTADGGRGAVRELTDLIEARLAGHQEES